MAMTGFIHDAAGLVGEGHAVVNTHGELWVLLLEDAGELDEVGTTAQMRCFGEVAVREDMTGAEVYEMGARSKLLSHLHHVVIGSS